MLPSSGGEGEGTCHMLNRFSLYDPMDSSPPGSSVHVKWPSRFSEIMPYITF